MLMRQSHRPLFTGGLEAALLRPWHVELLHRSKVQRAYFAYDTLDDREPLREAGLLLKERFSNPSSQFYCYVLCGYPGDTMEAAEARMFEAYSFGFFPFAMLYRDKSGRRDKQWMRFARTFSRPAATRSVLTGKSEVVR
jgi:hypothetical protein